MRSPLVSGKRSEPSIPDSKVEEDISLSTTWIEI